MYDAVLSWLLTLAQRITRVFFSLFSLKSKSLEESKEDIRIHEIFIYPIKSCVGISLKSCNFDACGLEWDRRWVIVTRDDNTFITQRQYPRMALIDVSLDNTSDDFVKLTLNAPGMPQFNLTSSDKDIRDTVVVTVWDDKVSGIYEGDVVSEWLSSYLKFSVCLLRKNPRIRRSLDSKYMDRVKSSFDYDTQTGFADGYPILVMVKESVDDVNEHLKARNKSTRVTTKNFRPNLVLTNPRHKVYSEEQWHGITISGLQLEFVKMCTRCILPNVDHETGVPSYEKEPLKTLMSYRRTDPEHKYEAVLGMNAVHLSYNVDSTLTVGDLVTVD